MAARPPLLNQLVIPANLNPSMDCGETCVAALLQVNGIMDTPEEEISDLNHSGSTNSDELSGLLRANGAVVTPLPAADFPTLLSSGDAWALILVHDNNNADPDPNGAFRHFLVGYAIDSSGAVKAMNPWGGRDMTYGRANLVASTIWVAVVRFPNGPKPPQPPIPTPTQQEYDMADVAFVPSWNGGQHTFNVDNAGNLIHRWYGGAAGWNKEAPLASALRANGSLDVVIDGPQLHVWSQRPDNRLFHCWQGAGTGTWHPEEIGP